MLSDKIMLMIKLSNDTRKTIRSDLEYVTLFNLKPLRTLFRIKASKKKVPIIITAMIIVSWFIYWLLYTNL